LQHGWTPLYRAAHKGYDAVVLALVEAGADINAKTKVSETGVGNGRG